jgi:hypothetical protein
MRITLPPGHAVTFTCWVCRQEYNYLVGRPSLTHCEPCDRERQDELAKAAWDLAFQERSFTGRRG